MKTIEDLIGIHNDKKGLIIGAGSSILENKNNIMDYVYTTGLITIGINNITDIIIPKYHLWTNTKRFITYGSSINKSSHILFGSNISLETIRDKLGSRGFSFYKENPITIINYKDKEGTSIGFEKNRILGYYRTAGCLAIMILHLMGCSEINIVGMDGYTLHGEKDIEIGKKSQHCYGTGLTDTTTWDICVKKDILINEVLNSLKEYGIDFNIITPTKYTKFFKEGII